MCKFYVYWPLQSLFKAKYMQQQVYKKAVHSLCTFCHGLLRPWKSLWPSNRLLIHRECNCKNQMGHRKPWAAQWIRKCEHWKGRREVNAQNCRVYFRLLWPVRCSSCSITCLLLAESLGCVQLPFCDYEFHKWTPFWSRDRDAECDSCMYTGVSNPLYYLWLR